MSTNKKDDNLAYASLELINFPKLQETILDRKSIFSKWDLHPNDLQDYEFVNTEPDLTIEQVTSINTTQGEISDLIEFVYAGRQIATMNCLQLAASIYT